MGSAAELENFLQQTSVRSEQRGVQWVVTGDTVEIRKTQKMDNQIDTDAVIQKLIEYSHEIETQI